MITPPVPTVTPKPRLWLVHDNGGRPFTVALDEPRGQLTVASPGSAWPLTFSVDRVWIPRGEAFRHAAGFDEVVARGDDGQHKWSRTLAADALPLIPRPEDAGNTVLARESSGSYVWIGGSVQRLWIDATVVDYRSPIGNNDVPYPVIYTPTHMIFSPAGTEWCEQARPAVRIADGYGPDGVGDPWAYCDRHRGPGQGDIASTVLVERGRTIR